MSGFRCILAFLLMLVSAHAMTDADRRQYLQKLLETLPDVKSFREWQQKTGELPPDFDAFPRRTDLPDPLQFLDGRLVKTPQDWAARRSEIKDLFQNYVLGKFPPRPKIGRVKLIDESHADGATVRHVALEFGPGSAGSLHVELLIPDGKGPFPVFMGPGIRTWAQLAVRRGYLCALYAGSDFQDDAGALAALFPQYDFAQIPQRAWVGSITLDYLATLPEADLRHVALTGHSRDGKQALIEAAFDERITAVIPSSSGAGGVYPYRLGGERGQGEGIEAITRAFPNWFHPRLRFFTGREDRLPVDGNLLVALVAPRSCLISYALNDSVEGAWPDEQSYFSALKAYRLLGHPERLGVRSRPGGHAIPLTDIEEYLDWFDMQFGRSDKVWVSTPIYDYDFERWRARSGEAVDLAKYPARGLDDILQDAHGGVIRSSKEWEKKVSELRKSVEWMLGEKPPRVPTAPPPSFRPAAVSTTRQTLPPADDITAQVLLSGGSYGWRKPASDVAATQLGVRFGQGVTGDLFYPASAAPDTRLPVVVWLHSYGYATGYWWAYHRETNPILALVNAGYAVLAFDQIGFGRRILEVKRYSDRFPHWSQLGQMVEDTRAAIDYLQTSNRIDPQRIYLFGYSLGGTVGIYTAALDDRVQGLVSICGFTPMRLDTAARGSGGVARFSREHEFIPRLGFFVGHENRIPYDFHELLGAIAPRSVLILQPQLDRDANPTDVRQAVEQSKKVYELYRAEDKLMLKEPWDYNRLSENTQNWIINEWMPANFR